MDQDDHNFIDNLRNDGIGVLRNVLSADEVKAVRLEFDQAHMDLGIGPGKPGERDKLSGEPLLAYPALAALYAHPRIMDIVSTMLNEPNPWVWQILTNRYNPEHVGVRKHTDGVLGELAPSFTRQSIAVFLDDTDESSGALTYVPLTHLLHYADEGDPDREPPTQEDIDTGDYKPATPSAGDVVFRVPEVWHAVIPIHGLRRYVTASYTIRGQMSKGMTERMETDKARRKESIVDGMSEGFRRYWEW
jgi:hypothetical protein